MGAEKETDRKLSPVTYELMEETEALSHKVMMWERTHGEEMRALSMAEQMKVKNAIYQTTLSEEELDGKSAEELIALYDAWAGKA